MTQVAPAEPLLEAPALARAFAYATDWLGVYVEEVNALNVYPVPDGDTGTNMHLTMQSVRQQLGSAAPKTMGELAHALSYGSLLGARGNSGVILSQILKGFAESIKGQRTLGSRAVIEALKSASKSAYAAVMKPVEGTILTVVRSAAEGAEGAASVSPLEVLRDALKAGDKALQSTPDQLPMLKQAGVVDSGGLGFLRVLEGIIASFEGRELPPPPTVTKHAQEAFAEQEFGFCTEFLLSDVTVPTEEIQAEVEHFGNSLLVVGAEGLRQRPYSHRRTRTTPRARRALRYGCQDQSRGHERAASRDFGRCRPERDCTAENGARRGERRVRRHQSVSQPRRTRGRRRSDKQPERARHRRRGAERRSDGRDRHAEQ